MKARAIQELQHGALSANNSTTAAVGSVLMQLLMMQLNARNLHPLFRQPIPWHFVSPIPAGTASNCSRADLSKQRLNPALRTACPAPTKHVGDYENRYL